MAIEAFIDPGFPSSRDFCIGFLRSPEFRTEALQLITHSKSRNRDALAISIADALEAGHLNPDEVMRVFASQPRKWLSLKYGTIDILPDLKSPALLLEQFGEDTWYGPIKGTEPRKQWYIRTFTEPHFTYIGIGEARTIDRRRIRWTVVAEVGLGSQNSTPYIALSWNGFSTNELTENRDIENKKQFPYWQYINPFFDELSRTLAAQVEHPLLHKLVLHDLWNKYLNDISYDWQHLRIRAESSGVALNAHSAGVADIDVRGLKALTHKLAESALRILNIPDTSSQASLVENALLQTLIKEWGTKSYEFSLKKINKPNYDGTSSKEVAGRMTNVFTSHCYFGSKPLSHDADSLQHLRCLLEHGGSGKALIFLLQELQL